MNADAEDDGGGAGLAIHAVVYVAVNLLLVAIWALFAPDGSFSAVPGLIAEPSQARAQGFFPIYVMVFWGAGLLIHAGIVFVTAPKRWRRRRAAAKAKRDRQAKLVATLGDNVLGDAAVAGIRLLDGDKAATKAERTAKKKNKKSARMAASGPKVKKVKKAKKADKSATSTRTDHDGRRAGRRAGPSTTTSAATAAPAGTEVDRRDPARDPGDRATFGRRATDQHGERHWVAVLFTDIVDSTPLNEALGDDRWAAVLSAHRALVRTHIAACGGVEVGTQGDGFLVRFETPDRAAACAVAIQRDLAEQRLAGSRTRAVSGDDGHGSDGHHGSGGRMRAAARSDDGDGSPLDALHVRIGIHAGEVVHNDDDLVGRVINLASRVTGAAGVDEILVTEPLADHLSPGHAIVDRGLQTLKGFDQPRHLLALVWQEAPDEIVL